MGHAGAADGLHQCFLNDAALYVEGKLAGSLLRRAPAHTVGEAAYVFNLLSLDPFALFGYGGRIMLCALCNAIHLFHFA